MLLYLNPFIHRHPDVAHRPTFNDLQISLQQPDYELLKWSEEDKATYSENARTIGASFKEEESLFKECRMQMLHEMQQNSIMHSII